MEPGEVFGVLGSLLLLILPALVFMLTRHQQRMAEIVHGGKRNQQNDALASEVRELRNLLMQQSIQIDALVQNQSAITQRLAETDVRQRLEAGR